jgi:hypothetical protein
VLGVVWGGADRRWSGVGRGVWLEGVPGAVLSVDVVLSVSRASTSAVNKTELVLIMYNYIRTVKTQHCTKLRAPAQVYTTLHKPILLQKSITRQNTHWEVNRQDICCPHLHPPCHARRTTAAPNCAAASTPWTSMLSSMLVEVPLLLPSHFSAPPLLIWALTGPPGSTAHRGRLGGATTHHWGPRRASQPKPPRA